jgi:WD40 repeat protein
MQLWVARYVGGDSAFSVAVSPGGGTVFVTGESASTSSGTDYATVAYSASTGARLWVKRYNGPGNINDAASSVVVSPGGRRVFVTGSSVGARTGRDYATIAYNAATGARLWVKRYNGPANSDDSASSVVVSPGGGTVFVTGSAATSQDPEMGTDYATVAYSAATGARLWVKRYNGPGNLYDDAFSVAVSPGGGRVFVTGRSFGATSGGDYATVAYSAATGARLWVKRYNGPANGDDSASSVAVSPGGGRVFVTGSSDRTTSAYEFDYETVAYNATTGERVWTARYNGPGNGVDSAHVVEVSPGGGTVFVAGGSYGTTGSSDYATVAYSAATGARRWVTRYDGTGNGDSAFSIAVNPDGSTVYVTGGSSGTTGFLDYATLAYSAATGARLWAARYNSPGETSYDDAYSVAVSPDGSRVFVTGTSSGRYGTLAYSG